MHLHGESDMLALSGLNLDFKVSVHAVMPNSNRDAAVLCSVASNVKPSTKAVLEPEKRKREYALNAISPILLEVTQ